MLPRLLFALPAMMVLLAACVGDGPPPRSYYGDGYYGTAPYRGGYNDGYRYGTYGRNRAPNAQQLQPAPPDGP